MRLWDSGVVLVMPERMLEKLWAMIVLVGNLNALAQVSVKWWHPKHMTNPALIQ